MPGRETTTEAPPTSRRAAVVAMIVALMGANVVSPLYPLYSNDVGLTATGITLANAAYVVAVVVALSVARRRRPDRPLRRPVVALLAVGLLGLSVLVAADAPTWILVARLVQGLSIGGLSVLLTAAIVAGGSTPGRAGPAAVVGIANAAGIGAGPLLSGLLVQLVPDPAVVAVVVVAVLQLACLVACSVAIAGPTPTSSASPTPITAADGAIPPTPLADEDRATRLTRAVDLVLAWSLIGVTLSLLPSYTREVAGDLAGVVSGAVIALVFAVSIVTQRTTTELSEPTARRLGTVGLVLAGTCVAGGSVLHDSAAASGSALLVVAIVLVGVAHGLVFDTAMRRAASSADPTRASATTYLISYGGNAVPAVGVGLLADASTLSSALVLYALALVVVAALAGVGQAVTTLRPRASRPGG